MQCNKKLGGELGRKLIIHWLNNRDRKAVGNNIPIIEPSSPWENGYNGSFNGKLRDEMLNGEIFYTLKEAQIIE